MATLQRLALRGTPKATKAAARYTPAGGAERCGQCRHFAPSSSCARIEGPISAAGWCALFSRQVTYPHHAGVQSFGAGGPSLDLDMMNGILPSGVTFTRASTATYFNSAGTMQTATANTPRWDYDPASHALLGLLIEEARTNLVLNSADASNASWTKTAGAAGAPVVTGNQVVAPDGTTTAARVVYPAVSGAGNYSALGATSGAATIAPYSFSVWARGNAGGEQVYLCTTPDGVTYYRSLLTLTTLWQRFSLVTPNLNTAGWFWIIGTDLRDAGQTAKPAQSIFVWGGQVETGAFPTSYIPSTAASVTRAGDLASMPTGTWFTAASGTYEGEFIPNGNAAGLPIVISGNAGSPTIAIGADSRLTAGIRSGAAVFSATGPVFTFGAVNKAAFAYLSGASRAAVNGTAFGPSATALTVTGTVVELGSDGVTPGANALDGWLRRVRYWPRALSAAELQSVTT